jgi:CRP-like cAMP-binding protein
LGNRRFLFSGMMLRASSVVMRKKAESPLRNSQRGSTVGLPPTNRLLEVLPAQTRSELLLHLEPVELPIYTVLYESESVPRYVHFLTSGIASTVTTFFAGSSVEVGFVGREGIAEKIHLLGPLTGMTRCFIQAAGTGLRMDFKRCKEMFANNPSLRAAILRLVQHEALVLAQLGACNRMHEGEERLARWLLMVQDRTGEPEMSLTHEFLAYMLGARRSTVNLAAGSLRRAGLIRYRRTNIRIETESDWKRPLANAIQSFEGCWTMCSRISMEVEPSGVYGAL